MKIEKNMDPLNEPFKNTIEALGVKSDDAEGSKAESYRDIGEERLNKATEKVSNIGKSISGFMRGSWNKIKSFGSKTKEVGKSALIYALASPDMVRDAKVAVEEGIDMFPNNSKTLIVCL